MDAAEVAELIARGSAADRAFADGVIRMRRAELGHLHPRLQARANEAHAELRGRIAGGLRGPELRALFEAAPDRDHFVEEVLGIAYPPLEEQALGPELTPYMPSGYAEILHAIDATGLARGQRFVDVGAGLGKAVLLAELLTDAECTGLELDPTLARLASDAAAALGLRARVTCGDARTAPLPPVDVMFLYLPFTGSVLAEVLARIACRYLCAGPLDAAKHPRLADLRAVGEPRSWLQVYAAPAGGNSSVADAPSTAPST